MNPESNNIHAVKNAVVRRVFICTNIKYIYIYIIVVATQGLNMNSLYR